MPLIDTVQLEQLLDLIGGDADALHELVETFLVEGDEIVTGMQETLATRDLDTLRRAGHSLKSSAEDFGAGHLSMLAATLESHCRLGWPDTADAQVRRIEDAFLAARTELAAWSAATRQR